MQSPETVSLIANNTAVDIAFIWSLVGLAVAGLFTIAESIIWDLGSNWKQRVFISFLLGPLWLAAHLVILAVLVIWKLLED